MAGNQPQKGNPTAVSMDFRPITDRRQDCRFHRDKENDLNFGTMGNCEVYIPA